MERIKDIKKQEKLVKIFKAVISAGLVAPVFVSVSSCKEVPAVVVEEEQQHEEEKPAVEDSAKAKEETREVNEETPPVVEEETSEKIEWEGLKITPIEGLRFDKGIFYSEAGNPYGLEEGEKAGVFVKDAVEINGVMESSIGLRTEVIKFMQKEIMGKEKAFRYPLPFDFEQAKGIKINEVGFPFLDDEYKSIGAFWEDNKRLEASNIPAGTKIYSPLDPSRFTIWRDDPSSPLEYAFYYYVFTSELHEEDLLFKNERFDLFSLTIIGIRLNLIPPGIEENKGRSFSAETIMGEPIAERKEKLLVANESITIIPSIYQLKDKDIKLELLGFASSNISKGLETGLAGLLKIEEIPVFISPADE